MLLSQILLRHLNQHYRHISNTNVLIPSKKQSQNILTMTRAEIISEKTRLKEAITNLCERELILVVSEIEALLLSKGVFKSDIKKLTAFFNVNGDIVIRLEIQSESEFMYIKQVKMEYKSERRKTAVLNDNFRALESETIEWINKIKKIY
jgi:hypothetical protein